MKSRRFAGFNILVLAAALGLALPAGCGSGSRAILPPAIPADAARKAIELYDTEKHGFLDARALEQAPALRVAFPGAAQVTEADIAERFAAWKRQQIGRMQFSVTVTHNGRPLRDATVRLVPESFLGEQFQAATGTTDQAGAAQPTVPLTDAEDISGVPPGFYRVEITKAGETIPAKYNSATTLGLEVPPVEDHHWRFDLQY
jgi:hypothetical protein